MSGIWVIGAGGHARVVLDAIRAAGLGPVAGLLDGDQERWGTAHAGYPIAGGATAEDLERFSVRRAVLAIGDNRIRADLAARLAGSIDWVTVVHPAACVAPDVRLGGGTVVFAGAVVQANAVLGSHAIVNTCASVDHDGILGDFAHVGPGARLAGRVRVGPGALLGTGCVVTPDRAIGDWATVGAGAVVVRDIPPGVTARGVPARF